MATMGDSGETDESQDGSNENTITITTNPTSDNATGKTMKLSVSPLPLDLITPGITMTVIGTRGSGKTYFIREFLSRLPIKFDHAFAMTDTINSAMDFEKFIPPSCVYCPGNEKFLDNLVELIKEMGLTSKKYLILTDDMFGKSWFRKSEAVNWIFCNGRHFNIFFITLCQDAKNITLLCRSNTDLAIAFDHDGTFKKRLHLEFFSRIESYVEFSALHDSLTQNQGAICYYKNKALKKGVYPGIFQYLAEPNPPPPFILGGRDQWKLHHLYYVPTDRSVNVKPIASLAKIKEHDFRGDTAESSNKSKNNDDPGMVVKLKKGKKHNGILPEFGEVRIIRRKKSTSASSSSKPSVTSVRSRSLPQTVTTTTGRQGSSTMRTINCLSSNNLLI